MFHEKVDLYEYYKLPREGAEKGTLTVYVPDHYQDWEGRKKIRPAILVIPGGGYQFVTRREGEPIAIAFLQAGYAAFVLDYDVKVSYPTPLLQAAMAMRYIRENGLRLGIDCSQVGVIGFSAGGHLAGMISTLYGEEEIIRSLGVSAQMLRPDATIYSYAVVSTEKGVGHADTVNTITGGKSALMQKLSIDYAVKSDAPPAFIWHTRDDDCVPVENTYRLAKAYEKQGVFYELHIFAHGRHGLSSCDIEVCNSDDSEGLQPNVRVWMALAQSFLEGLGFAVRD